MSEQSETRHDQPTGTDTPTGTDPDAKYEEPGYHDKSLGQAVDADSDLVDDLVDEADGDLDEAERRFDEESMGAPARERQEQDEVPERPQDSG